MRAKLVGAAVCLLGLAAPAVAQQPGWGGGWGPYSNFGGGWGGGYGGGGYGGGFPGMNAQNVMPNIYNQRTQPLSPYLNMLRGGNAGVNYYYGVRPGTVGGGAMFGAGGMATGGARPPFFPFQYTQDDALLLPEPEQGYTLPPAGHPTTFNNTLGYFPGGGFGQRGRGGFGGGMGGFGGQQGGAGGGQQRAPTPRTR